MINLDNPQTYPQVDQSSMLAHLHHLPEQCRQAWRQALALEMPSAYRKMRRVVVAGMGGSAIGGDLVAGLAALDGQEVLVHRDYGLPPGIDEDWLVILSSYSGETEETLSSLEAALKTPAKKLAITSGGKLMERAKALGIPVLPIEYQAPPRAVLGYSFIGLLGLLHQLGLVQDQAAAVDEALEHMEGQVHALAETVPLTRNPAKRLAQQFYGRLPHIYGGGFLAAVARRWKAQVNENSKAWAVAEAFPELNHNAVVGYEYPPEMAPHTFVALLHSPLLHPRLQLRYQITSEILAQRKIPHEILEGQGHQPLSHMMTLIYLGDYVSYYLALLYGVDPTPVQVVAFLKSRMAQL